MGRLDFHIEQKIAQRDSIDLAARRLADRPGWVVEFGLGRGRSYSHLVERFPDREIYCFDREHATMPGWGPPLDRVVLGELPALLEDPALQARFQGRVILAHLDLAWGDSTDTRLHRLIVDRTRGWLRPGAWILSDRPVPLDPASMLVPIDAPDGVGYAHRFHRYEYRPDP